MVCRLYLFGNDFYIILFFCLLRYFLVVLMNFKVSSVSLVSWVDINHITYFSSMPDTTSLYNFVIAQGCQSSVSKGKPFQNI